MLIKYKISAFTVFSLPDLLLWPTGNSLQIKIYRVGSFNQPTEIPPLMNFFPKKFQAKGVGFQGDDLSITFYITLTFTVKSVWSWL